MTNVSREYVDFLEDKIRKLESILAGSVHSVVLPPLVDLTPRQEQVLTLIVSRGEQTTTRELIYQTLYHDRADEPTMKNVDVLVSKLRQRLGDKYPFIETVYKKGYRANMVFVPFLTGAEDWNRTNE